MINLSIHCNGDSFGLCFDCICRGAKGPLRNQILRIIIAFFVVVFLRRSLSSFLQCYQCDSTTDGPEACNDDPANRCEFQHYHVSWLEWSHLIQKTSKNGVSLKKKKTSDMIIRGELKTCPPEQNAGCFIIESKNSTSVSPQKAYLWWTQYAVLQFLVLPRNTK